MEVVVTTEAISRTKLQSNCYHQQTNSQLFTGWMPFLSPNQQCQSTEGKNTTFHRHAHPNGNNHRCDNYRCWTMHTFARLLSSFSCWIFCESIWRIRSKARRSSAGMSTASASILAILTSDMPFAVFQFYAEFLCLTLKHLAKCASGCVVECRSCNWEVASLNLGRATLHQGLLSLSSLRGR